MLEAKLPDSGRARSLTIAGTADVVLGGIGLFIAYLLAILLGITAWVIASLAWWTYLLSGEPPFDPDRALTALVGILLSGVLFLASILADVALLALGFQLLRRSPRARRSAFVLVGLMVPLGALDVLAASQFGSTRWLALAFVLPLPLYSVGQLAAFYVLPSWRALRRVPAGTLDSAS